MTSDKTGHSGDQHAFSICTTTFIHKLFS
jgi:hypothetical protein